MTQRSQNGSVTAPRGFGQGYLFGAPLGELGWFTSLLMGLATGFAAFFGATFLGIIGTLVYTSVTRHAVDYTLSYKYIGLPVGVVVLVLAWTYLAILWSRRHLRRGESHPASGGQP
jgi:hypothetical protein